MTVLNSSPGGPAFDDYVKYLHESYRRIMILFVLKKTGNREVARDIVSDVFLNIQRKKPDFASIEHARNYFFVAINNELRKHGYQKNFIPLEETELDNYPDSQDCRTALFNGAPEQTEYIKTMLATLTGSEKKILTKFYLEEKSLDQIAIEMARDKEGVKSQKSLSLRRLRERFPTLPEKLLLMIISLLLFV